MKKLRWFEKFTASDFDLLIDAVKYTLADTEPATEDIDSLKAMVEQLSKLQADLYPGAGK